MQHNRHMLYVGRYNLCFKYQHFNICEISLSCFSWALLLSSLNTRTLLKETWNFIYRMLLDPVKLWTKVARDPSACGLNH